MSKKPQISNSKKKYAQVWFYFFVILEIIVGLFIILLLQVNILWASPWAWGYSAVIAILFLKFGYSTMSRRTFKVLLVYFLLCFSLVLPVFAVSSIMPNQSIAKNLTAQREINYFKSILGTSQNYTELYQWESTKLHWNNSSSMKDYTDPIQIYEYGMARCGGYAILYAELCISQGYQARIVVNIFGNHEWDELKLNGTWTRVDASPTGAPMNENIGHPLFYEEVWRKEPILVLAFETSSVVDVTSTYRSDGWSLFSGLTIALVLIGFWFSVCIFLIWKSVRAGRLGILRVNSLRSLKV